MDYQKHTHLLFIQQKETWPLLAENSEGLKNVLLKTLSFGGFSFKVQYNAKRITSSAAKVDKETIAARPCFLCQANRPIEQSQVLFEGSYDILCNPFPIFQEHFTIAGLNHIPQEIGNSFGQYLDISKALHKLVVFYNAPKCGASAPDHLHFQAGNLGFLPIESEYDNLRNRYGKELFNTPVISVVAIDDGLRRMVVLESDDKLSLESGFKPIYQFMKGLVAGEEPNLNILSWFSGQWRIIIFPRDKHRPWQYFAEGDENILLSPASVDLGGTLITPLEKDFHKISASDVADIMNQVCLPPETFEELCSFIKKSLK
ncbi:MAG TPA: DUF4922 domain-containing protein [Marinilabiliales bacterium]|nr:MAG: hypothetical protein A2W95_19370 [Bacteroidetes bacterium GWA2_40_14]OFX57340.1 MAG: hypothetical protein A2W84_00370 [Bacteroidetes bacterium GWC2_40_13]OFX76209.1 MAG: hypothetical protein A2W96_00485 [Bacteroidetes bacterium GWD2_40_43]OFX95342.1 MAG: hypothetical protein A2W97_07200 [Bacteroidetes bacterium GWE2_40_63]OFY19006.1 MAG: hypothetical protein A2W88_03685 [Bacteroidetes bacterium GWF2_40_13]OFZ24012.1 MAG: hypothetical protein A2437_06240 [Bacteroidetes bacterium RIFOXYC